MIINCLMTTFCRKLRKVPKSGTGYLTLEEEAHSFGSLQSPTYDIDL